MREGWSEVRLIEVTSKIGSGVTPRGGSSVYVEKGIPIFRSQNIYNGEFSTSGLAYINDTIASKMKNVEVVEDDVLLNITGDSVARCCIPPREFIPGRVNQHVSIIRPRKEKLNPRYLMYSLISPRMQATLLAFASGAGATRNALTKSVLENTKINLPPLKTQRKIASILSAYDDLIENNLKRIKLLEEQAQLTYEEWFVRFKFPGHETTTFNEETGLPEGWERKKLGNLIVNYDSKRVPVSKMQREQMQGKYPYYGAASIMDYVDDYLFDGRFVLMGEDGTVITNEGYPKLQFVQGKIWVNNHAHVLEGTKISNEFLYLFLNQYPIQGHVTGVAQPKINQKNLNRIKVIYATKDVRDRFDEVVKPNIDLNFNLQNQNQHLKEARDILLPRLMSGMIDPSASSGQVVEKLEVGSTTYEVTGQLGKVAEERSEYKKL